MIKRIAAAFLALMILIAVLPAEVYASAYETGEQLEINEKSVEDTEEGGDREPFTGDDGVLGGRSGETVEGSASFIVLNIDTNGNPLAGSEFYLLEPRVGENDVVKGTAFTNEHGEARFENLCLDEGVSTATWRLVQNIPPESELSDYYRPNTNKWDVTIVRKADGTHSLSIALSEDSEMVHDQDYSPDTGILTVVNEPLLGGMLLNVKCEGLGNDIPDDMVLRFTVEGPDGFRETMEININKAGSYLWQEKLEALAMGQYSIVNVESVTCEGYTLEASVIEVQFPGGERSEANSVVLSKEHAYATFTITNYFTAEEENEIPTEELPEVFGTIVVKNFDEAGGKLDGTTLALRDGENVVMEFSGDEYVLDLKSYAIEGKTVEYTLLQTKAPAGYHLADEQYTVEITKNSGEVRVVLKQNASFLARLFGGTSVEPDAEGVQQAIFTNTRKTAQLELEFEVDMDFGEAWEDREKAAQYRNEEYEFVLTWEDGGERQQEAMKLKHGESKTFEALIPYGISYEVKTANENVVFDGENEGTVGSEQLKGIQLEASSSYEIAPGDGLEISLMNVDATAGTPLTGAKFTLKDSEGVELETYTVGETGEIDITDAIEALGKYTLEQTAAPVGYAKLSEVIEIEVKAEYSQKETGILVQDLYAVVSHESVEEKDGIYLIKNTLSTDQDGADDVTGNGETTQIELDLEVAVRFSGGTWKDKSLQSEFLKQNYQFILQWKDDGEWKSETMKIKDGETKTFKTELPVDTEYRIMAVNESEYFETFFYGEDSGSVSQTQRNRKIRVSATNEYTIRSGDDADLYMVKVDATSKEPLEGAKFSLRDEDGYELDTFKTDEDGEIDIIGAFDAPGSYTLKETKAPEDYDKLNKPIEIEVAVEYSLKDTGVLEQDWYAVVSHKSVELRNDGTYLIKNTLSSDNPKTGDDSSIIWTGTLMVSTMGLAAVAAEVAREKRRKQ